MLKNWFINLGLIWLVAFATSLTAQPPLKKYDMKNYGKEWEDIQQFENKGLPKSALEATEKLYARIKADTQNPNREGHLIKAILFINKYQYINRRIYFTNIVYYSI